MASNAEFILLFDLGLTILAALLVSFLFRKAKLPMAVGQMVAGMLIGPFGLGLIQDLDLINLLASLGVILLMFTIGLELDPGEMLKLGPEILTVTVVELGATFVSVAAVGLAVGLTYLEAAFAAGVVSITSTAILGKLLIETKSLHSRAAKLALTVSVVEDVFSILLLILLPGLVVANAQVEALNWLLFVAKGILLVCIIFVFGWKIAPKIIDRLSERDDDYQEAAFLAALSFGFAFAILSSYLGFSPAIGAFLAGLMLRGQQADFVLRKIGPIKDLFIVLFFVSMGTLINLGALLTVTLPLVAILTVALLGKFFGSWAGVMLTKEKKEATRVGIEMLPMGEFAFIIAQEGVSLGVASQLLFPIAGLSTLLSAVITAIGLRVVRPKPISIARLEELATPLVDTGLANEGY